jgi:hypothetical protein
LVTLDLSCLAVAFASALSMPVVTGATHPARW